MIRALYVDDEPDLLSLGKHFLERSGEIQVDTILSPKEAIKKLTTERYDAVISDYQMPDMDGLEFLKQVRSTIGKIPFIIFTGKGREEVVIEALNCGVDFYLQKGGEPRSQFAELEYKIKLVNERSRMKKDLDLSKRRMRDIIDHLPDATFVIDSGGRVIAWNRAIEKMTGIPEGDMIGKGNYEYALLIYGKRRPILIDIALTGTSPEGYEYPFLRWDGNIVETEVVFPSPSTPGYPTIRNCCLWGRASPLYNTENEVIGAIESFRDITELKKTQEALEKSENLYRSVVEDQTEFIVRFLPDGTYIFVNDAYCRTFGKKREDLIGKKCLLKISREDAVRIRQNLQSLTQRHPVATITHQVILPGGDIRWMRWCDRAIFNNEGALAEFQSVGREVTDLKNHQDALHQAKKKNRLIASIVQHDFRNYLMILTGYLELAGKYPDNPEKLADFINKGKDAVKNIENLLNFTWDYLSIGMDAPTWQNLNKKIQEIVNAYPMQNIRVDVDSRHLEILADNLIDRIIFNLIHNAVRHGGDRLTLIRISFEEMNDGMKIIVEDDGPGIPDDSKKHLFEKTWGDRSIHGLFLIHEILAATGITITETGEPGKGARFEMSVPREKYHLSGQPTSP